MSSVTVSLLIRLPNASALTAMDAVDMAIDLVDMENDPVQQT